MLLIDKYAYTNKLSKTNPSIKISLVIISLFMTTIVSNDYLNLIIFLIMVYLTTSVAGIPLKEYLKILKIPMGFLLISILTIQPLTQSINLTTRVLGSVSATFFLGLTTPLNEIIIVLKKIKTPKIIIELIVLIYRFIFIFLEIAQEIYIAQDIRFGYSNIRNNLNSTSLLIRSLFVGVLLRYEEMVISLDCKLYNGEFKTGD